MIRVPSPVPEPPLFDAECRQPGMEWLAAQDELPDRPKDLWSPFRDDLREGFARRCGYYAMHLPDGQVDHFISWDSCKQDQRQLAYDWNNFRFLAGSLNSKKRTLDGQLLDPFEVEDSWFEVELPSFLLRVTDQLPPALLGKATLTLQRLELEQGRKALTLRWEWYEMHRTGLLILQGLHQLAPLVARAVEKWQADGRGPLPAIPRPVPEPVAP